MQKRLQIALFASLFLLLGVSTAPAQTTVFSENFEGTDLGNFSQFSVSSDANWSRVDDNGDGVAEINGYGSNEASDDWLISNAIDFSGTNAEKLTADIDKGFSGPDLKVKVSTDYSGSGDPTTATWTEERSISSGGVKTVDLSGYTGNSSVYVALQYTTTGTEAGDAALFQVDDVKVTSTVDPVVRFTSSSYAADEGAGSTNLTVELGGPDPSNSIDVDVQFNSGNSSASAGDIDNYSTQTVSFASSASSGDTKTVTLNLTDDTEKEGAENAEFSLANLNTSGDASIGNTGTTNLTILSDDRTINEARTDFENGTESKVVLEGTVSRAYGDYLRMQDGSGPTGASAIVVNSTSSSFRQDITNGNIQPGTQIRVVGTLTQFSGLIQIESANLIGYTIQGQGSAPSAQSVTLDELSSNGEDYESELIRITGLSFPSASGTFSYGTSYDVTDGSTTLTFRVQGADETALGGESIPSGTFAFEDVVSQFNNLGGVSDDSGYQLLGIRLGTALPVEMASFDAAQTGSSVTLTWKTASETNNAGFRVQQQTEGGWTSLGFVDSKATGGTTTEAQSYRFDVEDLSAGTHQFRLKQEDLNGTTSLSDVVSVDLRMQDAVSLSAPAPNPVRQQGTISFAVKEKTNATVSLFNTLGQKVATLYRGTPTAGESKTLTLSTDGLPSGLYLVRLQADGQTRTQRVTIVK